MFISGDELIHWQNEYGQRRASMQQTGMCWAHIDMQRVGRKEEGRFTIMLHEAANAIVAEAEANDCTHIAFEKLDGIRDRLPLGDMGPRMGLPPSVRLRFVQSGCSRDSGSTGKSEEHIAPVFTDGLWVYAPRQPTVDGRAGRVLLSEMRL